MRRTLRTVLGLSCVVMMILALVPGEPRYPVAMAQSAQSEGSGDFRFSQKSLFIFTTVEDFEKGETDGTEVIDSGNGAVGLKGGVSQGTYTSDVTETEPFEYMILSWNADTPESTYVEVQGKVRVKGQWSEWLSWGKWSTHAFSAKGRTVLPGSASGEDIDDPLARVAIDELVVKGQEGETANAFQYRLILYSSGDGSSGSGYVPVVRLVACAIRNTLPGQAIPKRYPDDAPDLSRLDKDLDVPTYSQSVRDARIASIICSPTCVAMVLSYYGVDISPEESAWNARDYGAGIFGNWSFNAASAAGYGFASYVDYIVSEEGADPWYEVKLEIAAGRPAVVSVRYRKPSYPGALPPVEGVPINKTDGHLVLVRGFTWKDGVEYVIVNDPAASHNDNVRREYRADEFANAWVKKVAYIVRQDPEEIDAARVMAPRPVVGELIPVGRSKEGYRKFKLQVGDETIDVSNANVRSIVVSYEGRKTTPVITRGSGEDADLLWVSTASEPGMYTYTFMGMDKNAYQASIEWPVAEPRTPLYIAGGAVLALALLVIVVFMQRVRKREPISARIPE